MNPPELDRVAERYARRQSGDRYHPLRPEVCWMTQERERAMVAMFCRQGIRDTADLRLLEVGCGAGGNLLRFLSLGFQAQHLSGVELLPDRHAVARATLPASLKLELGDATRADVAPQSQDLVFVSTVFSSLLDDAFQAQLAQAMWRWVRPGGAVLWYDFTVNNPRNPDVRGVPLRRIRELFPQGRVESRRVTLAPPVARRVCAVHPALYHVFNLLPALRTHLLCWIKKP